MAIWSWFLGWFIRSWLVHVNSSVGDTIAVVKGLNPTQTWIFFQAFFLQLRKLHLQLRWSSLHLPLNSSCRSNIWFSYIHIVSIMLFFLRRANGSPSECSPKEDCCWQWLKFRQPSIVIYAEWEWVVSCQLILFNSVHWPDWSIRSRYYWLFVNQLSSDLI